MDNFIKSETNEIFSIFKRIRNRDFKGNSGAVIRNSVYQITTTFVSKFGSLLFTIILARLLMPKLFGLYSLALGTILIFAFFADLGISSTTIRFVSKNISKNNPSKAKAYFLYSLKLKTLITCGILALFLILSKPLSIYYGKSLFLILLAGSLYLFSLSLTSFIQTFFQALNDFKTPFIRETLFQVLRLILIPLFVWYLISKSFSGETVLLTIFIFLGILWALMGFFLMSSAKKTSLFFSKKLELTPKEKKESNLFFKSLMAFSIFSIILTYSDIFILGRFVSSEYIGYYQVAIGLIGSLSTLVLFSGALFPVFNRLKGKSLEIGFNKSLRLTLFVSLILFFASLLFSKLLIILLYGEAYYQSVLFFRGLSFLLILWPITSLYNGYFMAKGKPQIIRNLLIFVAIFNFFFAFFLAGFLLKYNFSYSVLGVIFAIILSNLIYLVGCILKKRK